MSSEQNLTTRSGDSSMGEMRDVRDPIFGCLLAQGRRDRDGYVLEGSERAHIAAWVAANGPVPIGKVLDHLCRRRACKATHHLEPVTQSENEMRKLWRYRARRVACPRGHELATTRQVTPEGGIVCSRCNQEAAS